jgi:hypothetical protein
MSNTLQDYSKKIHSDCKNVGFELLFVHFYWFEWIGGWSFVWDIASGFVWDFDITKVFEIRDKKPIYTEDI